jgi:hypothetical protein
MRLVRSCHDADMDLLSSLENSGFSTWLKESNSLWAYPMVLTLHTIGLALLVGANTVLDLRLLGFAPRLPLEELARSFRVMWIGFWVNALSGVMLFAADATTKGATLLFLTKMALVALGVVVIVITRRQVFGNTPDRPRVTTAAKALAATSLLVWIAAIAAGRLMAYIVPT